MSNGTKVVRVWTCRRDVRKCFACNGQVQDLISSAAEKFGFQDTCRLVLESDGSQIDDDEVLAVLMSESPVFILLRSHEEWEPAASLQESNSSKYSGLQLCAEDSPFSIIAASPSVSKTSSSSGSTMCFDLTNLPQSIQKRLKDSAPLCKGDYRRVVQTICEQLNGVPPGRKALRSSLIELSVRYPTFHRWEYMLSKVEQKLYNMNRHKNESKKRQANKENVKKVDIVKKKRRLDKYGCVAFAPPVVDRAAQEQQVQTLLSMLPLKNRNEAEVESLLIATFPLQREAITSWLQTLAPISTLLHDWPIFLEAKSLYIHFCNLMGFDLQARMSEHYVEVAEQLTEFLTERPQKKCMKNEPTSSKVARSEEFLPNLLAYFHEQLIYTVESPVTDVKVVARAAGVERGLCLVVEGSETSPRHIFVVMDKSEVWRCGIADYQKALEVLMALQFVFHVAYSAPLTLEFVQRVVLGLNPPEPCPKSAPRKKCQGFTVALPLTTLLQDLQKRFSRYSC